MAILLSVLSLRLDAQARDANKQEKIAITRAVNMHIRRNNPNVGKLKVIGFDVQGTWAKVLLVPAKKNIDAADCILHIQKGRWKVMMLGTGMMGEGKKYSVPEKLRKNWGV